MKWREFCYAMAVIGVVILMVSSCAAMMLLVFDVLGTRIDSSTYVEETLTEMDL